MNPYQELGVEKDADEGAIKRAFRRRARETHPDKGGAKEEFQRVNAAYQVVSDPKRRAQYDATGDGGTGIDDEQQRLLSIMANLVLGVVNAVEDPNTIDVMKEVRRRIEADLATVEAAIKDAQKKGNRLERAMKRVTKKSGGENVVAAILQSEVAKMNTIVEVQKTNIATLHRLAYTYRVDEPPPAEFITVRMGISTYQFKDAP